LGGAGSARQQNETSERLKTHGLAFVCGGRSWGGLEMNVRRLARWFQERGERVVLFADRNSPVFEQAMLQGITAIHFMSSFKYGDIVNARRLSSFMARHKLDMLVLHTNRQLLVSVLAKLLSRRPIKLIYQQHMHIGDKRDWFHRWEYGHIDAWVAPLPMFARRVERQTSLPAERIATIPFGIEIERFSPATPETKLKAREQLGLPGDGWIVGVVGRLDPKKGQDLLIEAVQRLHQSGVPAYALVVGDATRGEGDSYGRSLRRQVSHAGLEAYVHFRPHMEEVATVYAALDVFALTSHSETYGMVTIEAMAAGLPVVGSNDGGTMEIIRHEQNGLLFTPLDAEELSRCLKRLHDEPAFASRLARQARQDAVEQYSHETQCRLWGELLRQLRKSGSGAD
ncbi:MAG: glycosyltransferase family 1 protein, partial [Candidatus Zixiibacteriota bacterium]